MITLNSLNLKEAEKAILTQALKEANGKILSASALTGLSRATLYRKLPRLFSRDELRSLLNRKDWWA